LSVSPAQTTLLALITAGERASAPEDEHARFDNGSDYRPNGLEHSAFPTLA
jgi:hypothetical protein